MVNSSSSSSKQNTTRLTYAERAKKGSNTNTSAKRNKSATISPSPLTTPAEDPFPSVSQSTKPSTAPSTSSVKNTISYAQASSHTLPKKRVPAIASATPLAHAGSSAPRASQTRVQTAESAPSHHQHDYHDTTSRNSLSAFTSEDHAQGQDHDRLQIAGMERGDYRSSFPPNAYPQAGGNSGWDHQSSPSTGSGSPLLVQPGLAPAHQAFSAESTTEYGYTASSSYNQGYSQPFSPAGYTASYVQPQDYYSQPSSYSSSPGQTPPISSPPYAYPPPVPVAYPVFMVPIYYPSPVPQGYWTGHHSQPGSGYHTPAAYSHYSGTPPSYTPPVATANGTYSPSEAYVPSGLGRPQRSRQGSSRPGPPQDSQPVSGYGLPGNERDGYHENGFMSFGSMDASDEWSNPSSPRIESHEDDASLLESDLTPLSIGISPDDEGHPRFRSRSRSHTQSSVRSRTATFSDDGFLEVREETIGGEEVLLQKIDLANPDESNWRFGTISTAMDSGDSELSRPASAPPEKNATEAPETNPLSKSYNAYPPTSAHSSEQQLPSLNPFLNSPSRELHKRLEELTLEELTITPQPATAETQDPFTVRNLGYGFGSRNQSPTTKTPNNEQKVEQDLSRGGGWYDYSDKRGEESYQRPRRGYSGNDNRGYYNGRRGRGGYGRGGNRRGGGFQPRQHNYGHSPRGHKSHHYGSSTFHSSQGSEQYNSGYNGYTPRHGDTRSTEEGSKPSSSSTPAPVTLLSFPVDPTRWRLLGQLEHYLKPQSIRTDEALQRKMDSEGWIPLSVLRDYRDISQYNADVGFVHEVLQLSTLVELSEQSVRVLNWREMVPSTPSPLPERADEQSAEQEATQHANSDASAVHSDHDRTSEEEEEEEEEDYDSDEDVVIVINQEEDL